MGCWAIVGDETWGAQDEREAIATIQTAYEMGINFFDTAEGYGHGYSEQLLGKGLKRHRQEVIIASKVSSNHLAPEGVIRACENSLRHLQTDYIDLYQIHWPGTRQVPFAETLGALENLKAAGKIRAIGVSNFGEQDLTDFLNCGRVEANQLPYNLLWRAIEYEIQPLCIENEMSILPYSPLAQGLLTGKFQTADDVPDGRARTRFFSDKRVLTRHGEPGYETAVFTAIQRIRTVCTQLQLPMAQVALAWLLHQPGVTSVLAGARTPAQIKENVPAAQRQLAADVCTTLAEITQPIKVHFGANPDLWESDQTSRFR